MIGQATTVLTRSLKDLWEELTPLSLANLVWFGAWALPLVLVLSAPPGVIAYTLVLAAVLLYGLTTAGLYHAANRVAHGRTGALADLFAGARTYWPQALLWLAGNAAVLILVAAGLFYVAARLPGGAAVLVQVVCLAALLFWAVMQLYFWPMLIQLEDPRVGMAWRYSAMLIAIDPALALWLVVLTLVALAIGVATGILLALVSGALIAVLANNTVLALLHRLGKIEDPRPPVPGV
jgi:hypothetical protein